MSQHSNSRFCVRTKDSIRTYRFDKENKCAVEENFMQSDKIARPITGDCNDCSLAFATNGTYAAFATTEQVSIQDIRNATELFSTGERNVTNVCFSPLGTFCVTYFLPVSDANILNIAILEIKAMFIQVRFRQYLWPAVLWPPNESYSIRQTSTSVMVFDRNQRTVKFEVPVVSIKGKDHAVGLHNTHFILVSPSCGKTHLPGKIVCYSLQQLDKPIINHEVKEFDSSEIKWSPTGEHAVIIIRCDFDRLNQSYYGSSKLLIVNIKKRSVSRVALDEGVPIHDIEWSPSPSRCEFIVVSGKMPHNDATIFDALGKPVYHFGQVPRNTVRWSTSQPRLFALGGSGSLNGEFQFYDRERLGKPEFQHGKLGTFNMKSLEYEWSPCGEYLLTSIVYTRQRAGNKVCIFKYTGECCLELPLENICETRWIPQAPGMYPERKELENPISPDTSTGPAKSALFKPRHQSAGALAILARSANETEGFAGSRKIDAQKSSLPPGATVLLDEPTTTSKKKVAPPKPSLAPTVTLGDGECLDKKLKTLMKKLRQVEDLKGKDKKSLNAEQLDKLKKEPQLRCDIAYLEELLAKDEGVGSS